VNEEMQNPPQGESGQQRRLYRSVSNRHVAGVCGGMAEYFNVDPMIVRVIWFFSIFFHGVGLFAYIAAWIIVPENRQAVTAPPQPRAQNNAQYILGAVLVVLGVIFLADRFDWDFLVPWHWDRFLPYWVNWGVVFSVFIIVLGMMLIFRPGQDATKSSPFFSPSSDQPAASESTGTGTTGGFRISEKRLIRSVNERMIGGVCGGLAKYFNIDPSFVRIGFVVMTISSGMIFGIVTYIVMMIVVPEETPTTKNHSVTPVGNI
jgi:phage shock protein PspC (stress-responsive transcriptional regulator)